MNKRSRMGSRRFKKHAEGWKIPSKFEQTQRPIRIMTTLDPISFECLRQLSETYELPISRIIRFAVEIYLTGNQDDDIARLASKIRENSYD